MNVQALSSLRQALAAGPADHLDAETIAELATAEAAGDELEQDYPQAIAHIETCVECAQAYSELVDMLIAAVGAPPTPAAQTSPEQALTDLLLKEMPLEGIAEETARTWLQATIARLPGLFPTVPSFLPYNMRVMYAQPPREKPDNWFPTAPRSIADIAAVASTAAAGAPAQFWSALAKSLEQRLSALNLLLTQKAEAAWGRALELQPNQAQSWYTLEFHPSPQPVAPLLSPGAAGEVWHLARHQMGSPAPWRVVVQAERVSPLACRVIIRVDRPGEGDPAGRRVELHIAGQTLSAETDASGTAVFMQTPIAALPEMEIRFQD